MKSYAMKPYVYGKRAVGPRHSLSLFLAFLCEKARIRSSRGNLFGDGVGRQMIAKPHPLLQALCVWLSKTPG